MHVLLFDEFLWRDRSRIGGQVLLAQEVAHEVLDPVAFGLRSLVEYAQQRHGLLAVPRHQDAVVELRDLADTALELEIFDRPDDRPLLLFFDAGSAHGESVFAGQFGLAEQCADGGPKHRDGGDHCAAREHQHRHSWTLDGAGDQSTADHHSRERPAQHGRGLLIEVTALRLCLGLRLRLRGFDFCVTAHSSRSLSSWSSLSSYSSRGPAARASSE